MTFYTMKIKNFSQRNAPIRSNLFRSKFCNWYVTVYPKGNGIDTHMSIYLEVADPRSLSQGWWRRTLFSFVVVNQFDANKSKRLTTWSRVFNEKNPGWGFKKALRLTKLEDKRFLANQDTLEIRVEVTVDDICGRLDPYVLPEKAKAEAEAEVEDAAFTYVNGFQVLNSQVKLAKMIFETYPETALYIHPQDPQLKTAYMNILLRIYETLYNSPLEKLTEAELSNVSKGLLDLTQAGFKMEWFREKLRKKLSDYEARARELGEQLKDLDILGY